jgi:hypothetical protein
MQLVMSETGLEIIFRSGVASLACVSGREGDSCDLQPVTGIKNENGNDYSTNGFTLVFRTSKLFPRYLSQRYMCRLPNKTKPFPC